MLQLLLTGIKYSANINIEKKLNSTLIRLLLLSFLILWTIGFLQPTFLTQNNSLANYFLAKIYSRVCHQESSKCIIIANESMLVCARCAGIYFGAMIAGLLTLIHSIPELKLKVLLIASIPLLLDVCLTFLGVYKYSPTIAFITGLAFGSVIYLFLLSELENLFSNKSINRNE
jgi:uncharacterized membrane protein